MKSALEQHPLPPLPEPGAVQLVEFVRTVAPHDKVEYSQWFTADQMRSYASAALAAADAELAATPEPVAWAQLGMRNGHTYVRMNYEGHLYPPPPDVQRNLNLVPLYAAPVAALAAQTGLTPINDLVQMPDGTVMHKDDAPVAAPAAQPLTNVEVATLCTQPAGARWYWDQVREFARAIERAHGIAPKEQA